MAYITHSGDLVHVDSGKGNKHVILKESVLPLFVDHGSQEKLSTNLSKKHYCSKELDSPHIVKLLDYLSRIIALTLSSNTSTVSI